LTDRPKNAITGPPRKSQRIPVTLSAAWLQLNQPLAVNQLVPQNLTSTRLHTRKNTQFMVQDF
jgi:hypothetical protein